jgi:predicted nucleic acid-binding protein
MAYVTFDTSFIISRKVSSLPDNFLLSEVVVMELMASANDESERKMYEAMRAVHEKEGTLIVPTSEDWLMAGRVLYWLTKGRKKKAGGKAPKLIPGASQNMALDALIAVSAKRAGAAVVTENYDDFKVIGYYLDGLSVRRGSQFTKG